MAHYGKLMAAQIPILNLKVGSQLPHYNGFSEMKSIQNDYIEASMSLVDMKIPDYPLVDGSIQMAKSQSHPRLPTPPSSTSQSNPTQSDCNSTDTISNQNGNGNGVAVTTEMMANLSTQYSSLAYSGIIDGSCVVNPESRNPAEIFPQSNAVQQPNPSPRQNHVIPGSNNSPQMQQSLPPNFTMAHAHTQNVNPLPTNDIPSNNPTPFQPVNPTTMDNSLIEHHQLPPNPRPVHVNNPAQFQQPNARYPGQQQPPHQIKTPYPQQVNAVHQPQILPSNQAPVSYHQTAVMSHHTDFPSRKSSPFPMQSSQQIVYQSRPNPPPSMYNSAPQRPNVNQHPMQASNLQQLNYNGYRSRPEYITEHAYNAGYHQQRPANSIPVQNPNISYQQQRPPQIPKQQTIAPYNIAQRPYSSAPQQGVPAVVMQANPNVQPAPKPNKYSVPKLQDYC